jgi:ankyrin repeat protein
MDELAILSFFGLFRTVLVLMESTESQDASLGLALYWVSRNGHTSCVEEILSRYPHVGSPVHVNRLSPVVVAAQHGSSGCLRALIRSRTLDADELGAGGRTPLSLAEAGGHEEAVRILLENDIGVNQPDHSDSPPLF